MGGGIWRRALSMFGVEEEDIADDPWPPATGPVPNPGRDRRRGGAASRASSRPLVGLPGGGEKHGLPLRIAVLKPRNFEEAREAADQLKGRRPVILNLEATDRETGQRILNFLSGALYALDGEIHPVGPGVMLMAPGGVTVTGRWGERA